MDTGVMDTEKWLRLFEQQSPIYKWTQGGLRKVNRAAPKVSSYAASFKCGKVEIYFFLVELIRASPLLIPLCAKCWAHFQHKPG
jgi:hypothetical protein